VRVATHVYDERDLSNGRSAPAIELTRTSLDADGPARLADRVREALREHFHLARLTPSFDDEVPTATSFAAHETHLDSEHSLLEGDFDGAIATAREAIALDPNEALFYCALSCALSYGNVPGAEGEIRDALDHARALRGRVGQRHTKLIVDHDILWGETD